VSRLARFDARWIGALALLGLVSRLPFLTRYLYHWDAVNFALALRKFDINIHQPQPPGYVLYVMLGRVAAAIIPDANTALIGVSILSAILAAVGLYLLGKRMFDMSTGAAASLMLLFSPLVWFYSLIAKPNIVDAPLVTWCALLLWDVMRSNRRMILPAAIVLGLAGGFRQQTLVFLAPLAVYAFRKLPFSRMLLGGGVTALVFLASFVPMVIATGGLAQYQAAMAGLQSSFFVHTSIFMGGGLAGLVSNVTKWVTFTAYALLLAGVPLGLWLLARLRQAPRALRDERTWFILFWALPSLLFYTLIHMGSHGLIFTFLPAVVLLAGKGLADLSAGRGKMALPAALLVILLVNVFAFAVMPEQPVPGRGFHVVNLRTLRENDRAYTAKFDTLRSDFDPATTLVVTEEWRHAQYYLPEYWVLSAPCSSSEDSAGWTGSLYLSHDGKYTQLRLQDSAAAISPDLRALVLLDGPVGCYFPGELGSRINTVTPAGQALSYLRLEPGEQFGSVNGALQIQPAP
jgi:hypothetical protein